MLVRRVYQAGFRILTKAACVANCNESIGASLITFVALPLTVEIVVDAEVGDYETAVSSWSFCGCISRCLTYFVPFKKKACTLFIFISLPSFLLIL